MSNKLINVKISSELWNAYQNLHDLSMEADPLIYEPEIILLNSNLDDQYVKIIFQDDVDLNADSINEVLKIAKKYKLSCQVYAENDRVIAEMFNVNDNYVGVEE